MVLAMNGSLKRTRHIPEGPATAYMLGSQLVWTALTGVLMVLGAPEWVGGLMVLGYCLLFVTYAVLVALYAPTWQQARRSQGQPGKVNAEAVDPRWLAAQVLVTQLREVARNSDEMLLLDRIDERLAEVQALAQRNRQAEEAIALLSASSDSPEEPSADFDRLAGSLTILFRSLEESDSFNTKESVEDLVAEILGTAEIAALKDR